MDHVYYRLDHQYIRPHLFPRALQAQDRARVKALEEISTRLPVEVFLAIIEKEESGSCDGTYRQSKDPQVLGYHPLREITSSKVKFILLNDLDTFPVRKEIVFDTRLTLQDDFFDVFPRESWGPYSGDSETTHWYRVSVSLQNDRHCNQLLSKLSIINRL